MCSIKMRQETERRIARVAIRGLLAHGYSISVDNGDDESARFTRTADVLGAMFATDEDVLLAWRADGSYAGFVRFIYGNGGYDVISDYSVGLEPALKSANELADRLSD